MMSGSISIPTVEITALAIADCGTRAVTGDLDHGLTVWDLSTPPEPLRRLPHQSGRVNAVALTAGGTHVAAASEPGDVTVWDVETGDLRHQFRHGRPVTALCLTPAADRVVVGDTQAATVHAVPAQNTAADAGSPATETVIGRLATRATVTALAANPAIATDVLLGTALGQIAYVRVP